MDGQKRELAKLSETVESVQQDVQTVGALAVETLPSATQRSRSYSWAPKNPTLQGHCGGRGASLHTAAESCSPSEYAPKSPSIRSQVKILPPLGLSSLHSATLRDRRCCATASCMRNGVPTFPREGQGLGLASRRGTSRQALGAKREAEPGRLKDGIVLSALACPATLHSRCCGALLGCACHRLPKCWCKY